MIIAIIIFFIVKYKQLPKSGNKQTILKYGSSGSDVVRLQKKINEIIKREGTIMYIVDNSGTGINELIDEDGFFGRNTQLALLAITGWSFIDVKDIDSLDIR